MLTDKDVKILLKEYYKTYSDINIITDELIHKNKELDDILESLTLTSQRLSGMPHGTGISNPVERIYEENQKIQQQYADRITYIRKRLEETTKKQNVLQRWIEDSELDELEVSVMDKLYKDGMMDWKIAQIVHCNTRTVWKIRARIFEKLKNSN